MLQQDKELEITNKEEVKQELKSLT